ncbi:MAG: antitoxin Xre/MbcA/ParS toxin-binding domain-containing protein [Coriobacteriia bacterium]
MSIRSAAAVDGALADILASRPASVEQIRVGLGMTIEEFAEAVGRSVRTVSRWQTAGGDSSTARGDAAREVRKLAQLQYLLEDVLGNEYAPEWLRSPNRGFRGKAPIDLVLEGQVGVVTAALERLADGGPA